MPSCRLPDHPTPITAILTHPGSSHKDDLLACCVLIHKHRTPVLRREPTEADLADPATCVVDVGGHHQPELANFDHHQLPADHPPTCALSLVLQHLGVYEDARMFCDWLETAEYLDSRGPLEATRWLGVERRVLNQLNSPVDMTLLRRFASRSEIVPGDPLWEVMRWIGEDIMVYLNSLRHRLDFVSAHADTWDLGPFRAVFLPRVEPLAGEPSAGLARHINTIDSEGKVIAMVYPDRRGPGYGLSRHNDDLRLDFTRIAHEPDVHFAHARWFVAKTTATDPARLRELLRAAFVAHAVGH
ncbi:hypothetical protein BH23VER1_BH23VER1_36800 [soil metagenome]